MKQLAKLGITLCLAGASCFAAHLDGRLMDANCYHEKKLATQEAGHKTYGSITKDCVATPSSTEYLLRVTSHNYAGLTMRLDSNGASLAAQDLKNGTLKPEKDGAIHVRAEGKVEGASEMLKTEELAAD